MRLPSCPWPVERRLDEHAIALRARPRVTLAWYIEERDSGGNARTRWPTLTSAASAAGHEGGDGLACAVDRAGRADPGLDRPDETSVTVSVSSSAWDSVTAVERFGVERVWSRTPWALSRCQLRRA